MEASGPLVRYRALVESGRLKHDPAQQAVVDRLQACFDQLVSKKAGWLGRLRKHYRPVQGLYLHGRVGRGKTLLMDLFAGSLDAAGIPVWRIHFHRFMDHVQNELGKRTGQRDPLPDIAADIAARCRVLCFDELHVGDIGDAMILGGLFTRLFERGLCLVATSNSAPDELYADGLQRQRFVPAIAALEKHCDVIELISENDYRLRELRRSKVFFSPLDEQARENMRERFDSLARGNNASSGDLTVRGRKIVPVRRAGPVVWFDFDTLCRGPRSSSDYIDLAQRFETLLISNVPAMSDMDNNPARRFIHLVDECYDRSVNLIVSAAAGPAGLYTGTQLNAPFERTASRLIEMQSRDYLARPHRSWSPPAAAGQAAGS